jgi:tetratricopeptide (TPR) repeat protein
VQDRVRLFRNHPDVRYCYPIHEQITPAIAELAQREGGEILPSPLAMVHYETADRDDKNKRARNQRLLSLAVESYPEEPYFRYQLACEMALYLHELPLPVKGFRQMNEELRSAVQLVSEMSEQHASHLSYGPDLFSRYAAALLATGAGDEALEIVREGIQRFGMTSLLRFHLGMALLAVGEESLERVAEAEGCMRHMLHGDESVETSPISSAYFQLYPHRYLGLASLRRGDFEAARRHFESALSSDPGYTGALCGLARLAEADGRPKEALQIYLRALSLNESEVDAWIEGSELLVRLGFGDNALSWLQKLTTTLPEHPRVQELLATIQEERSEYAGQV